MRKIAQELGVVPMALYKHVAGKDELLGGMIDVVIGRSTRPPTTSTGRRASVSGSSQLATPCSAIRGHPE